MWVFMTMLVMGALLENEDHVSLLALHRSYHSAYPARSSLPDKCSLVSHLLLQTYTGFDLCSK